MSIIPQFILDLVNAYLDPLLDWFSERVYADLIKRAPDHLLIKLRDHLDLKPLEEACASFHHDSGPGRPVMHTMPRLVRALLVKYLYDYGLRGGSGPDHSPLERFEQCGKLAGCARTSGAPSSTRRCIGCTHPLRSTRLFPNSASRFRSAIRCG